MEATLPTGASEQAVADADTFCGGEQSPVRRWTFDSEGARWVAQPVLAAAGGESARVWRLSVMPRDLLLA